MPPAMVMQIPVSDPKSGDSLALFVAVRVGRDECINLLFDISDVPFVLHQLQTVYPDNKKYSWLRLSEPPPTNNICESLFVLTIVFVCYTSSNFRRQLCFFSLF